MNLDRKTNTVRWGLLGSGAISQQFALQLAHVPEARLCGVASRRRCRSEEFARRFGGHAYDSYAQLCESPEIDIVYIATPTLLHREHCLLALGNRKAVLCEKPFAFDVGSASEVVDFARRQGLFCMEAMWMRFHPRILKLREMLHGGRIGSVREIRAEVGWAKEDCEDRSEDRGAMLTFGCYALSLAWFLLGPPASHSSHVIRNRHAADLSSGMLLRYPDVLVALTASICATQSNQIVVVGSHGSIRVHAPFFDPPSMDVSTSGPWPPGKSKHTVLRDILGVRVLSALRLIKHGAGLRGEIAECVRCLHGNLTESPVMPLDETIAIHDCLDRIRLGLG